MIFEFRTVKIKGKECRLHLQHIEEEDRSTLRSIFEDWKKLSMKIKNFGLKRGVNIHEAISESALSLELGFPRLTKITGPKGTKAFDNFDLKKNERIQLKASSNTDTPSSFGPTSESDICYFMDFDRGGLLDGRFDLYRIPNKKIESVQMSIDKKFKQLRKQGKRPRPIVMDVIKKYDIRSKTFKI